MVDAVVEGENSGPSPTVPDNAADIYPLLNRTSIDSAAAPTTPA
jgi:hypothetical protein